MVSKFLIKIYNTFFLSSFEKELYKSLSIKKKICIQKKEIILIQCVEDYYYFSLFGAITNTLREKKEIQVEQYILRNLTVGSYNNIFAFIKNILFSNRFRDNKWIKLYSAYCDDVAYRHEGNTSLLLNLKAFYKAYKIFKSISSKEGLISLSINSIPVGDLIYDSYLRFKPNPTVNLNDFYLCIIIWKCIINIHVTNSYFNIKHPSVLLTSYSTYIQHGIAVRVAINYNTKIYSFGNTQAFSTQLTKKNHYHMGEFGHYKKAFNYLNDQKKCLNEAKISLTNRLNGGIDNATSYMKESAYKVYTTEIPDVKGHVIVFLHDFFDSPHIFGKMVFPDFLEWIEFTIDVLERNNIPYYLKAHPNQISDNKRVIEQIKQKYKDVNFISSKITNKQLANGSISAGITLYGTVAHELVYMGVPVILCGENQHSSYNFCSKATSREEYTNLIENHTSLSVSIFDREEIESFYYMYNLNHSKMMQNLIDDCKLLSQYCLQKENPLNTKDFSKTLTKIQQNSEFVSFIESLLAEV